MKMVFITAMTITAMKMVFITAMTIPAMDISIKGELTVDELREVLTEAEFGEECRVPAAGKGGGVGSGSADGVELVGAPEEVRWQSRGEAIL